MAALSNDWQNPYGLSTLLDLADDWLSDYLLEGLVGYWKFNETGGTLASDSSGQGNHGTLMNMDNSDWVAGTQGNALEFDNIDDYVEISGFSGVTGSSPRTCMAWIKTAGGGDILGWGNHLDLGTKWRFRVLSSGLLAIQVGGYAQTTSATVHDGTWHHVAVVLPQKSTPLINDLELYIDGNRITDITTSAGTSSLDTGSDNTVKIGTYVYDGAGLDYFDGMIDDVRIYDRALSQQEIADIAMPSP
jgi:hypothetical protein